MSGEATEVGSIVGYLSLNRDQWIRDVRATEDDVKRLGAMSPSIKIETNAATVLAQLAAVKKASDEVGHQSPTVRVNTNAASQTKQMHLLLDSILAVGAAAVPVAGVVGGAAIGVVPVLAAVALGIKGISEAEKNGTLQASQYGADVRSVQLWLTQLKSTAASGLLAGSDQAIKNSRPLFGLLTSDIRDTSSQMGEIIGHTAPALLSIFTQLNPLFVTFGNLIAHGAVELEHWAASGHGVQGFVGYVQANLPSVMNFLGNLITLVSHVAQASAGFGGGMLTGLNLLVHGIDALPLGVLQALIQLVVAARVAMLANRGVTAVVNAVSGAYVGLEAAQARQAAMAELDAKINEQVALEMQAAAEAEAAAVATAKAEEAQAWAALVLAADNASASIVIASQNEARAAQEAALVAQAAAAETAAAATTMAAEIDTAGVVAGAGWKAAMGPAVGLAVVVGILSTAFFGNHDAAKQAAEAANSYSESVKSSTDALSEVNIAQTNKNLSDKGALKTLADLTKANAVAGVSNVDLALAINGTADQYDNVTAKLKAFIAANPGYGTGKKNSGAIADQVVAAKGLIGTLGALRTGLQDQILTQTQLNQLNAASIGITDDQAVAAAALYGLTGTTGVAAYLAMQAAQQKSTQQAQAQTLAWQGQNAAASLLQQTLDKLSGKKLSYAQADNAFEQQLVSLVKNTTKGGSALSGMSQAAIENRGSLLQLIQGAEQTAGAYGDMTGSTEKGRQKLIQLRQEIIDNAVAHGENRKAVTDYIDSLLTIPKSVTPTAVDIKDAATKKIADIQNEIHTIRQDKAPLLQVDAVTAAVQIAQLQAEIDRLNGKTIDISVLLNVNQAAAKAADIAHRATGGGVDDGWFTVGEQGYELGYKQGAQVRIYSHDQSKRMTGQDRVPGYASGSGDIVTLNPVKSKSHATSSGHGVTAQQEATFANAAVSLVIAATAMTDTAAQLRSSSLALDSAARSAHVSESTIKAIMGEQNTLIADAAARDKIRAALGTAPTSGTTAYDRLTSAQQAYASSRSSAAGAITSSYQFGAVSPQAGTDINAGDFVTAGAQAVARASAFAADIKALKAKGLDAADLATLEAQGPAALAQANALAHATSDQIKQINAQHVSLLGIANGLGTAVADATDGTLVKAAQTVVNGLIAHEKSLTTAMVNLAKAIGGQLAGHNASGTENWSGGWTWVGEKGPELMNLPGGTKIRSNSASRAMVSGQEGGGPVSVRVFIGNEEIRNIARVEVQQGIGAAAREFATLGGYS